MSRVYFIGAGPGDPELLTLKGWKILKEAQVVIYAGSLINEEILRWAPPTAETYNSAALSLEDIIAIMERAVREKKVVARLHSGDPSLYGAIAEQMAALEERGIPYEVIPGVSSFLAAAALLKNEYTLPGISQTVILTRVEGRTPVPEKEKLSLLAQHGASLCIFLSTHLIEEVVAAVSSGYTPDTPVAVVERASWPEGRVIQGTLKNIASRVREAKINKTALILIGDFLVAKGERSRLYSREFSHGWREAGE